jgi:DNA polymerase III subunit epsilon
MDFVALDFETATSARDSACEIGLAWVRNGQVAESGSWLIKPPCYPYFDYWNIKVHGIRPQDVANAPTFAELWPQLLPQLQGQLIIAHNASFDLRVLRDMLDAYQLPYPTVHYVCSVGVARKVWPGLRSYGLAGLCHHHQLPLNHHRAGDDARACAELSIRAFAEVGLTQLADFPGKLRTVVGRLDQQGFQASYTKKSGKATSPI